MSLAFRNRRFSPSLFGAVLTVIGVALFVRLGMWQLDRADQKAALVALFTAGEQTTAPLTTADTTALPRYQRVRARGRYDAAHQILIDNMPSAEGRPGYRVLTPFALEGGGWVLVDRGWIGLGVSRDVLPEVSVPEDVREVRGRLDQLPAPGLRMGVQAVDPGGRFPHVLNFPEHAQLQALLQRPIGGQIVLLDEGEPDGYERRWQMQMRVGPERHVGYAVQWFAFAFVATILFVVLSFRRTDDSNEHVP